MTNFAAVMRECLVIIMNRIDKVEKDEHDFIRSQKKLVMLRQAIEKFYRWHTIKYTDEAMPLWVFGEVALRELEQGTSVHRVQQMFSHAVAKKYKATLKRAREIYSTVPEGGV